MKCKAPQTIDQELGKVRPCGNCLHCTINKRRVWTHRLMREAQYHEHSAFITLTYKEAPEGGTLVPEHARNWLKRLRKKVSPLKLRFFLVGEYGDKTWRPHYHAIVFGLPTCRHGRSRYTRPYNYKNCCTFCDLVRDSWASTPGGGLVMLDLVNQNTVQYVSGYVTKKMTNPRKKGFWMHSADVIPSLPECRVVRV